MRSFILLSFILILLGCATKPDVWKQNRECLHGKIHKVGSVYICIEIGGDAKDKKY